MADNTQLPVGGVGDIIRNKDRTTAKTPISLIDVGGTSGSEAVVGDSGIAMPVRGLAAENAAVSGNPVLVGGRYDATPRTLGDGDVGAPALTVNGYTIVSVTGTVTVGSHAVTNAGTFAVQVDGTALTRLTDIETNTDFGAVVGGGTEAAALRVTIANNSTGVLSVDDNGAALTVDGTVAATQSGTWTVDLGATDNAVLDAIAASVAGTLTVGSHAVTNAGVFVTQENGAALTALQVIDDWDESDRAKVNLIVGQAGIAAGTGTDGATVPRVTLATNVGLPAGSNNIGDVDVLSVPKSIRGPSEPSVDSYTTVAISAAANTADQVLVASPGANKQIWVYGFVGTADTGDGSISLQDSDNVAGSGVMEVTRRGGFAINPSGNFSMPWLKNTTNKALEIDTVTCGFKGVLSYAIVDVT